MRIAPVLVCLVVLLAGCNTAFGPVDRSSPTVTPAATPTATPTPSATSRPLPGDVGLAADGVVEPLTLREAHVEALRNRSYTLERTATVRRPNGSVVVRLDKRFATGPDRDIFVWNRTRVVAADADLWLEVLYSGPASERAYSNITTTVVEVVNDDVETVDRYDEVGTSISPFVGAYRDFTGHEMVLRTFLQVDTRVTGIDRDGDTVTYHLVDADGPQDLRTDSAFEVESRVLSLRATVERSGLVRSISLRYALRHENETVIVTDVLNVSAVGSTTVERPPWVDSLAEDS